MSMTPQSGLFIGADGRIFDATNGMADTGMTANIRNYAPHGGLILGADENLYDIVTLLKNGAQASEMPEASADNVGRVIQYTGETTEEYMLGHFYQSVEDSGEYAWVHLDFGATGLTATVVGHRLVLQ